MEESICMPMQAEDSSSEIKIFPLLSPEMESESLKETWPELETNTLNKTTFPPYWEENFQDLSDWCVVDPQKISRFHTPDPFQKHHDYHIGEETKSKNSGVKDNYDNLSHIKSESKEIGGINEYLTVDKNIVSTGMSFEESLPVGQDQFNIVTDISDVWSDPLTITSGINEGQIMDSTELIISNKNENEHVPDHSLDLIGETIDNWFPIITTDNNITSHELVDDIQCNDDILDNYQSTSANNSTNDKLKKKQPLKDILLTTDVGSDSFDLLSYVCDEGGNLLDRKDNNDDDDKEKSTISEISESTKIANKSKSSRSRREKKISQVRAKIEPYVLPLKINVKSKNLSEKKNSRRISKHIEQESVNDTDSESDSHTSDYNYRELREKNNMASRKSRINKKVKESEMLKKASDLERANAVLKMKVEELEKLVTSMRTALLQSALKKENN